MPLLANVDAWVKYYKRRADAVPIAGTSNIGPGLAGGNKTAPTHLLPVEVVKQNDVENTKGVDKPSEHVTIQEVTPAAQNLAQAVEQVSQIKEGQSPYPQSIVPPALAKSLKQHGSGVSNSRKRQARNTKKKTTKPAKKTKPGKKKSSNSTKKKGTNQTKKSKAKPKPRQKDFLS